jgi:hypothetical protein
MSKNQKSEVKGQKSENFPQSSGKKLSANKIQPAKPEDTTFMRFDGEPPADK